MDSEKALVTKCGQLRKNCPLWDPGLNGGIPRSRELTDVLPDDLGAPSTYGGRRESGRPAPDLLGVW